MQKRKEALAVMEEPEDRGPVNGPLPEINPTKTMAKLAMMAGMYGISEEEKKTLMEAVTLIAMKY